MPGRSEPGETSSGGAVAVVGAAGAGEAGGGAVHGGAQEVGRVALVVALAVLGLARHADVGADDLAGAGDDATAALPHVDEVAAAPLAHRMLAVARRGVGRVVPDLAAAIRGVEGAVAPTIVVGHVTSLFQYVRLPQRHTKFLSQRYGTDRETFHDTDCGGSEKRRK